ncbi:MAG: hypothetical protein WC584_03125 [Candidatus Pacearchaeota archaeon]
MGDKIFKMNRKAEQFTLAETMKIILAVLSIGMLLYLAVSLYGLFAKKSEIQQAKASMEQLYFQIEKVENGEKDFLEVVVESPNDWWIIAWPYKDKTEKPEQCKKDYCICICNIPNVPSVENSLAECNSLGVCKDVSTKIKTLYKSHPEEWYAIVLKKVVGLWKDTENVPLDIGGPLSVKIYKSLGEIIVGK